MPQNELNLPSSRRSSLLLTAKGGYPYKTLLKIKRSITDQIEALTKPYDLVVCLSGDPGICMALEWACLSMRRSWLWLDPANFDGDISRLAALLDCNPAAYFANEIGAIIRFTGSEPDVGNLCIAQSPYGFFVKGSGTTTRSKEYGKIRLTSGTSGESKAIFYDTRTLNIVHHNMQKALEGLSGKALLLTTPLFWAAGTFIIPAMSLGFQVYVSRSISETRRLVANIDSDDLIIFATPNIVSSIVKDKSLSGLLGHYSATFIIAGGPLQVSLAEELSRLSANSQVLVWFGMTEATLPVLMGKYKPSSAIASASATVPYTQFASGYLGSEFSQVEGQNDIYELVIRGKAARARRIGSTGAYGQIRTGDLFRPASISGSMEYIGRRETVINIDGVLVFLEKIEANIASSLRIKRAVVGIRRSKSEILLKVLLERHSPEDKSPLSDARRVVAKIITEAGVPDTAQDVRFGVADITPNGKLKRA